MNMTKLVIIFKYKLIISNNYMGSHNLIISPLYFANIIGAFYLETRLRSSLSHVHIQYGSLRAKDAIPHRLLIVANFQRLQQRP